jgi:hypothetical protein
MTDTQKPTAEQKNENIIKALTIAGFTENPEYPGMYAQINGNIKTVVDLTAGTSAYLYDIVKNKKITEDSSGLLKAMVDLITDAEDGRMPTKSDADEVVHVPKKDTEDNKDTLPEPAQDTTDTGNVPAVPEPAQACAPTENNLLDLIQKYVGNDVLQVFGDTGAGKSKFCFEVAMQAIAAGKKVYYLDTERNLTDADVAHLKGCDYHYTPVLDEIDKIVQNLPAVDVVILDSIGFPVLTTYARLSMKQKGDALLQLIAIFGDLKTWAYKNNGVAVVTNQPESEFNKEKGHIFRPFGDKSQFACKEIWKTKIKTRGATVTNISIEAFRSRSVGMGAKIAMMKITDSGVEVST